MMTFERGYLGDLLGLDRTDFGMSMNLGGKKSLTVGETSASLATADLNRTTVNYVDKNIELTAGQRDIEKGFTTTGFVDSERDLLTSLIGFKETDYRLKWDVFKGLKLDTYMFDAQSDTLNQSKTIRNTLLNWAVNKNTMIDYVSQSQVSDCPRTSFMRIPLSA